MALEDDLPVGTRVMAPLGRSMHKARVVASPTHDEAAGAVVGVEFDPPIKAAAEGEWITHATFEACRLDLGWPEQANATV